MLMRIVPVLFLHSRRSFCECEKQPTGSVLLAVLRGCCSRAKQLCCSGQQATALYVFYRQWNLYEPGVTSTWMGPSVLVLFWRHLISAHGTHSLKLGHTMARMHFKGNLGALWRNQSVVIWTIHRSVELICATMSLWRLQTQLCTGSIHRSIYNSIWC